jgi:hypothetical protein
MSYVHQLGICSSDYWLTSYSRRRKLNATYSNLRCSVFFYCAILSFFLEIYWVFFWWYLEFVSGDILSLFLVISWVCFWWYLEFVTQDITRNKLNISPGINSIYHQKQTQDITRKNSRYHQKQYFVLLILRKVWRYQRGNPSILCVCFVYRCLFFFFWPLCCLITPLVSSNFS